MTEQDTSSMNTYHVTVAGLPLHLKSSHSQDKVNRLVSIVNERVDKALDNGGSKVSFQKALVIACLELAEDWLSVSEITQKELIDVEKRAKQILDVLDSPAVSQMGQ